MDNLANQLAAADTPYRAWAAVALLNAPNARHRAEGRRLAAEIADLMPQATDLQHADLAAYALLDGIGFLSPEQRNRLRLALPRPHAERSRRSRLFRSSVYIYLLARGVGSTLQWADDLVRLVDSELNALTDRASPDLADLALLLGARIELADTLALPDDILRRVRGRVAGAEGSNEGATALHWLIEFYRSRWPKGDQGTELLETGARYVGSWAGAAGSTIDDRPVALAMQLETISRRDAEYRLVSHDDVVKARRRQRRWAEAGAYVVCVALLAGGPMLAVVKAGWLEPRIAWASGLGVGVPAATWAVLIVFERPRVVTVLGAGMTVGLLYWAASLYAGWMQGVALKTFLAGDSALVELLVATVASIWAGVSAMRRP